MKERKKGDKDKKNGNSDHKASSHFDTVDTVDSIWVGYCGLILSLYPWTLSHLI